MIALLRKTKRKLGELLAGGEADWRTEVPSPVLRRVPMDAPISLIDLGANEGDFTRALSRKYRIARAILAEPLPHLAEKLRREFPAPVYTVTDCAVSDREGSVDFEINEEEVTSSMLRMKRDHPALAEIPLGVRQRIQVRSRTLDGLVKEAGWDSVDLLKIDVQGVEDKVLAGAAETLRRTRAVWIEVSWKPLYENSAMLQDIYRMLDPDFRMMDMAPAFRAPDGEIMQSNAMFVHR